MMGVLYNAMHKYYIERLIELGVTHSQLGHPVRELDMDEAHYEFVLAEMNQIDIESDANKWFR